MLKKLFIFLFAIFVATDSFATTDIASNAESSTCNDTVLGTTEGDVNFDAKWQANNIQLRWYNQGELLSVQTAAQTCNYDGALTIPSTEPERTGYTFAGWTVVPGVPSGYTQLQYIESTGTQYIDTMVKIASTDIIQSEFANTSSTAYGALYGVYASGESSAFYANATYYGYNENNQKVNTNVAVNADWHNVTHNFVNGTIVLDGNTTTFTPFTFTNTVNNYLFARFYNDSYGYYFQGKCRKHKIIRAGNVIRNLIPAKRNSDNEVGMWDTVSETFFTNAGSGTFTAGPDAQDAQ